MLMFRAKVFNLYVAIYCKLKNYCYGLGMTGFMLITNINVTVELDFCLHKSFIRDRIVERHADTKLLCDKLEFCSFLNVLMPKPLLVSLKPRF